MYYKTEKFILNRASKFLVFIDFNNNIILWPYGGVGAVLKLTVQLGEEGRREGRPACPHPGMWYRGRVILLSPL